MSVKPQHLQVIPCIKRKALPLLETFPVDGRAFYFHCLFLLLALPSGSVPDATLVEPHNNLQNEGIDSVWVLLCLTLSDARVLGVPLACFPELARATPEALARFELTPRGIHCEALDEDLSLMDY